jgi:hypothetical protein
MINSCFARPLDIGVSWNKIRVALRFSMTDPGASIGGLSFGVGLCDGQTNILGDATTDHFVGALVNANTWTRGAGPPVTFYPANVLGAKRVSTTLTTTTTMHTPASGMIAADPATGYRVLFFVDITKGSPNFTIGGFVHQSASPSDVSYDTFRLQAEAASPSLTDHLAMVDRTIAVDEATDGFLDSVNIWWSSSAGLIEISDTAIVRLS